MVTYKKAADPLPTEADRQVPPIPGRMGRVMNSQMNVSLPIEMHERLREIAWEHRRPLSHVVRELLETGLREHETLRPREAAPNGADEGTRGE